MSNYLEKYGNSLLEAIAEYRNELASALEEQFQDEAASAAPGTQVPKRGTPVTARAIERDNAARAKAIESINAAYSKVSDAIGLDVAAAPTEEQARILQTLSLRDPQSVAQFEIDTIAEKIRGNHQASAALSDIATRCKLAPPALPEALISQGLVNDARDIALSSIEVGGSRLSDNLSTIAETIERRLNGLNQFGEKLKTLRQ